MYLKSYLSLLLISDFFGNGFGFLESSNAFYQLNKKMDDIVLVSKVSHYGVNTRWIEQKLDHFNSKDGRKWKMRYIENLIFWKPNGPIYLFIGGESPITQSWAMGGIVYEMASETNGAIYVSEHRYYGRSKPYSENTVENMKFLTERQALADIAYLLIYLKLHSSYKNSKVVVVGGSYPGNLAAWMRLHYPSLVDAAISSSAPVLAKKDFYEYLEKINDNYALYGTPGCIDNIREKFKRYEKLMQSAEGMKLLKKEENICQFSDLTVRENQQYFFFYKVSKYMSTSQNGDLEAIRKHCGNLNDDYFLQMNDEPYLWNEATNCIDINFKTYINQYRQQGRDWIFTWIYQTCTAFGYFQTANSKKQPFSNVIQVDFFIKTCQALFGPNFNERRVDEGIMKINSLYGGLRPNVTNVVFTNGGLDPWSNLGILEDISSKAPAVFISHSSHCQDLLQGSRTNDEQLRIAVKYIKNLIKHWIGQ